MLPLLSTMAVIFTVSGVVAATSAVEPAPSVSTSLAAVVGSLVGLAGVLDRILRILLAYKKMYEDLADTVRNKGPDSIFDTLAERPEDSALIKRLKKKTHDSIPNPPTKAAKIGNALRFVGSLLPLLGRSKLFK